VVYQAGKRVLITDPHEINDPLSDVLIALADEVKQLTLRVECLDGELQAARQEPAIGLVAEKEESARYRIEQLGRSDDMSMGEGI